MNYRLLSPTPETCCIDIGNMMAKHVFGWQNIQTRTSQKVNNLRRRIELPNFVLQTYSEIDFYHFLNCFFQFHSINRFWVGLHLSIYAAYDRILGLMNTIHFSLTEVFFLLSYLLI
ncbi:hypothetical protein MANES_17G101501v8 [Manihot esculenta]|uniref:Uncharacterized protein n=1 Tax=Manihot esculenta TaxID=3983 RepID=A0ACB7G4R7_MANES|nr:hypothetical protein MANES_17G101501v8 [Manihot esculenta]